MSKHNIHVSNVSEPVNHATAVTALFLMIGALRNYAVSQASLRNQEWRGSPPAALGHDPDGKLLGILGMGGIGRDFAKKCRALGMTVQYHNRNKLSEKEEDGAKYVEFDELLKTSDVLSLNLPLNVRSIPHLICRLPTDSYGVHSPRLAI